MINWTFRWGAVQYNMHIYNYVMKKESCSIDIVTINKQNYCKELNNNYMNVLYFNWQDKCIVLKQQQQPN